MPDFTMRDANGDIHVVGNASDRARLLAQGYTDVTDEATPDTAADAAEDNAAAAEPASTPDTPTAAKPRPAPPGKKNADLISGDVTNT